MNLDWLASVRLFFRNEKEAFLFLGTEKKPRSTYIRITDRFDTPKFYPPTPLDILHEKFNKDITLDNSLISDEFKLLLSLITRERLNNPIIPYTEELSNWIDQAVETDVLKYIIQIISNEKRIARQHALYKLVKTRSDTSETVLTCMMNLRDEISIAIIRELGRWNIYMDSAIEFTAINADKEGPLGFYSRLYQIRHKKRKMDNNDVKNSITLVKKFNSIHKIKFDLKNNAHQTFEGLPYLAISDKVLFANIIDKLVKYRLSGKNYRTALMRIIKYAEMLGSVELVGGLICMVLNNRSVHIYRDKQTIYFHKDEFLVYPRQRLLNLINIWEKAGREDLLDEILIFIIRHIPAETNLFGKTRYKYINMRQWLNTMPLIKEHTNRIQLLLYNDQELLRDIIIHLSRNFNLHFYTWLLQHIDNEIIKEILSELSFNDKLYIYSSAYIYPPNFNILYYLKKDSKNATFGHCDFVPTRDNLKQTLSFFYRLRFILPDRIFDQLAELIHDDNYKKIKMHSLLVKYLKKVIYRHREMSDRYANIILDRIISNKHSNCKLCVNQLNYLKNWKKYTTHPIPEKWQDIITGIEIVHKEVIGKIAVDGITPMTIKTITTSYRIMNGKIHPIIEDNIKFALNKYNWDQLARHYLALGLERPLREALIGSELKNIPKMILRDQLGRIALVSQTIIYGMEFGFTPALENVIINNIYMRGWNIDNNIQNRLIRLLGSVSFKFRSFIAAYLILEKSEVSNEILLLARDVSSKVIRDRLLRTLERFGSADMWYVLAGSTFEDLSETAIEQLRRLRMGKEDRLRLIQILLNAEKAELREMALRWMLNLEFIEDEIIPLFTSIYTDTWSDLIDYFITHIRYIKEMYPDFTNILEDMIWRIASPVHVNDKIVKLATKFDKLRHSLEELSNTSIKSRSAVILQKLVGEFND